jgi:undecaprenyl-diphosphatase
MMAATIAARRSGTPVRDQGLRPALRLVLGLVLTLGVMLLAGRLVTGPLVHDWPFTAEDSLDRFLAAHRDGPLNVASGFFSTVANTPSAATLSLIVVVTLRVTTHRWGEALFVAVALTAEVGVFLLTTLIIERPRPAVARMDLAPPTSSFPSGHTAAAVALYGAVTLVLLRHFASRFAWLLLLVPVAVGASRLYRGMHHPSDVVAGLVLGALCVFWAERTVLRTFSPPGPRTRFTRVPPVIGRSEKEQQQGAPPREGRQL